MLQKKSAPLNFTEGLDTKTDPNQVRFGKFLSLKNSVFTTGMRFTKRNGYGPLASLPDTSSTYLTTFGGNLTALGPTLRAYSSGNNSWVSKGNIQPLSLSVLPTVRSALNQNQCDSVVAPNGLVCTVFTEVNNGTQSCKYTIQDSVTGQNIVNPTVIPVLAGSVGNVYKFTVTAANATLNATYTNNGNTYLVSSTIASGTTLYTSGNGAPTASGTLTKATGSGDATITFSGSTPIYGSPRVFLLGGYFIIAFTNVLTTTTHLQYVAISINNPTSVSTNADLAADYVAATTVSWDGVVVGTKLFFAYNTISGGQQVKISYLNTSLAVAAAQSFSGSIATMMSVTADSTNSSSPVIYAAFYDSAGSTGNVIAVDQNLNKLMTATQIIATGTYKNITSTAKNRIVTVALEQSNTYSYGASLPTNLLRSVSVTLPNTVTTGSITTALATFVRSLGLASKAFLLNGTMYMLGAFQSSLQNTYFLLDVSGNIYSRFGYENGGGYLTTGLPQAQVSDTTVYIAYLFTDLIQTTTTSGLAESIGGAGLANVYVQTGVNLVSLDFSADTLSASEIGNNLNISGGMLWAYDGQTISEQGFHLFPDNIIVTTATGSGGLVAGDYYYQVTYEWTDAQGNIIRSAPSVPVKQTTTTSNSTNTINIPYMRLTYKTGVKIVIYRWSTTQPEYHQVTSITAPSLNVTTSDSLAYVDTQSDAAISGNSLIYTTGGVLENIAGPALTATTLFDNRFWGIDAEDPNLLWESKQVIEGVPVEMSDLLTNFVAPTIGAQGSTGKLKCIFPMDDKLILFKNDAIYYINGSGPDNTGANNGYSQPIFVTSNVGCSNQRSIVLVPNGLMFKSDKGIYLLGRGLETIYIGADVEQFNSSTVNSAVSIPGTTQVRFTLSSGETLMYDYFYGQWGTFVGVPAISATLYQNLHTYINSSGAVSQETPGVYLDNGNPVLLSFLTSWLNLTGLQGYQRAYFFYLLGKYISPHRLQIGIAYDYNSTLVSAPVITPVSPGVAYGTVSPYGQGSFGGDDVENWRVFLSKQRCSSFQISVQEIYDSTQGVAAGAGLTLSGVNIIYGSKQSFRPQPAATSVG